MRYACKSYRTFSQALLKDLAKVGVCEQIRVVDPKTVRFPHLSVEVLAVDFLSKPMLRLRLLR